MEKSSIFSGLLRWVKSLLRFKIYTEKEVKLCCHSFYLQGISKAAGDNAAKLREEDLVEFEPVWGEYQRTLKLLENQTKKRKSG